MNRCNDVATKIKTLNEIIDNASTLPVECQDLLLSIAKGMASFTKHCLLNQGYPLPFTSETEKQYSNLKTI